MNNTPCPLCNHLWHRSFLAFVKREYKEHGRLMNELQEHRAKCTVINTQWYRLLWPNAIVVEVTTNA